MDNRYRNVIKKKRKRKFLVSLVSIIVISSIIVIFAFLQKKTVITGEPEELLKQYMAYIDHRNYVKMYEMLDIQSQNNISKEDFILRNKNIYEGMEASNVKVSIKNVENSQKSEAVISYNTTFDTVAGEISFDNQASFTMENELGYRLEWDHKMLFPSLEATDKVRISSLEAKRGTILDRNDGLLAGKGIASSVGLVPGKMRENEEDDIAELAQLLDMSIETIEEKLDATWVNEDTFVPIKTIEKLDEYELLLIDPSEEVLKKKELQEGLLTIAGIKITDVEVRSYPLGEQAAHLVGYVQNITAEELEADDKNVYKATSQIGKVGLESLYEDRLRGKNGWKIAIINKDAYEKVILALMPAQDGESIKVTIDAEIQGLLYDQYSEDNSASVAMNPLTGEVLALVSTPAYDNNDFVRGISTNKWTALIEDENNPLYNRFRAAWCPGSSIKPVIATIGVSTGKINPEETFEYSGLSWQKDASWGSYKISTLHEYENVVLENALIYSDNIYFAKAALMIGADTLETQLTNIGFDETLPFAIKMSASSFSNENSFGTEIQLADSGYGQGQMLMNPLHLATIYTTFVNRGSMIMPYLEYTNEIKSTYWKEHLFSEEAVDIIKAALLQVVEDPNGTAHSAKIDGWSIAGKTGTAEIKRSQEDASGTELGWYATFTTDADIEKSLLIVTMVEDVKERGGSGYVVTRNKTILEAILNQE